MITATSAMVARSTSAPTTTPAADDPSAVAAHGIAGRDRVLREFSIEAMVKGYDALYRTVTGSRPGTWTFDLEADPAIVEDLRTAFPLLRFEVGDTPLVQRYRP